MGEMRRISIVRGLPKRIYNKKLEGRDHDEEAS